MNLFRSEEHVRRWWAYDPAAADGILPVAQWARVFGGDYYRRKLDPDFFLYGLELRKEIFQILAELHTAGPFWNVPSR